MDDILGDIEYPSSKLNVYWNKLLVQGWAFSKNGNDLIIDVYLDNKLVDTARWGLARFDIWQTYKTEPSYESGFLAKCPMTAFDEGEHVLRIVAKGHSLERVLSEVTIIKGRRTKGDEPRQRTHFPVGAPGSFRAIGQRYFDIMTKHHLKSSNKVLEVGCGMGRITMPLTRYLSDGEYYGLDIIPSAIKYCESHITRRYPNFHFLLANVYNSMYNPAGPPASEYTFPFQDNLFDFVYLHSVFTHLILKDMQRYVHEISRVLKPDGISIVSYFLINHQKLQDKRYKNFIEMGNGVYALDPNMPEKAIAYDEGLIKEIYQAHGLQIMENQAGKRQNIVIGKKSDNAR